MINALVWFAKLFLVAQVTAGIAILTLLAWWMALDEPLTLLRFLSIVGVGVGLLASAGFAAVLFQISDRLAELIAQGEAKAHGQTITTGTARREPSLRSAR